MQTTTLNATSTFDALNTALGSARALNNLICGCLWHSVDLTKDDANGIGDLFDRVFCDVDTELADLRGMIDEANKRAALDAQAGQPAATRPLSAKDRLAARIDNIKLILRDTDYSLVAERYALPQETIRDILYGMIDAPQRVHPDKLNADERPADMTPVKPIDFEGEVTGAADAERAERIKRTVDKLTKKDAPDDDAGAAGKTGTND